MISHEHDANPPVKRRGVRTILRSPPFWIMAFAACCYILLFFTGKFEPAFSPDSSDYLSSAESIGSILRGDVDTLRTPVYPALIALSRLVFGNDHACRAIVVLQYCLYFASIPCFYAIAKCYDMGNLCTGFAALCYSVTPTLIAWNQMMLTESLAISSAVFWVFLLLIYRERPTFGTAILLGASIFVLVMLRPSFLFLVPILLLFWGLAACVSFRDIRKHLTGLACTAVSIALILGYCHLVEKKCGVFNLTEVAVSNQFQIIIQSGLYEKSDDREMVDKIDAAIAKDRQEHPDLQPGNPWVYPGGLPDETFRRYFWSTRPKIAAAEESSAFVREILRDHKREYLRYSLGKFFGVRNEVIGGRLSTRIMTFQLIYFLLAIEAVTVALSVFRRREPALLWSMVWLLIAGVIVTTVVGAQHTSLAIIPSEYSRLVVSAIPFVIILIFRYLDVLLCYWRTIAKKPGP